jgi:hypothetical protein
MLVPNQNSSCLRTFCIDYSRATASGEVTVRNPMKLPEASSGDATVKRTEETEGTQDVLHLDGFVMVELIW